MVIMGNLFVFNDPKMLQAYCKRSCICINLNKTSQLKAQVNVSIKDDFQFGEALESVYPLLELVFDYLDYNDLQLVATMNKTWQETAHKVLDKRNKIGWLTVFQRKREIQVHYSNHFYYNNAQLGLILFNYRTISLSDRLCCHEDDYCQPKKLKLSDILAQQIIPRGVKYCVVACNGVSYFSENITSKSKISIFDGFIIPPIPNVRISLNYCSPGRVDDLIQPNEKIKCLLLFSKRLLNVTTILEQFIPESEWWTCAFGGGVIHRTLVLPETEKPKTSNLLDNLCITITENRYCESVFDTASVVINAVTTNKEFEEQLLTFKRNIIIRSNSFALRFCCTAKPRKNHEMKIFNKLFPNTPLLGLGVEGEFGWDCTNALTNSSDDNQMKKLKHGYPQSQHQWSTVIVFLTWGRILNETL